MHRLEKNILHHAKQRKQLRELVEQKNEKQFHEIHKEFKLLCKSILNDDISREMLKGYAQSYLYILNKAKTTLKDSHDLG